MPMNKLRSALPDLIGRTIKHLVFNENGNFSQIFLHFTDGTYYEFYGPHLNGIRHLDKGGLELHRAYGYIAEKGRLEVVDAETTIVLQRPVVPVASIIEASR